MKLCILSILCILCGRYVLAQPSTYVQRTYETQRTSDPPVIDGGLTDPAWELVPWGEGFVQRSPYDGAPPTQLTAFKIVYDDHALYVAIRAYDTEPGKIERRMSRRDGFPGDLVEINIDSYHDKRTAFSFTPSASGVKGDEFVTEDGNSWDPSWDPVWRVKTRVDSLGWTAECAIPLSQLRFSNQDEQVWGLQVMRHDFREESRSFWQPIPLNSGYWVSGFGELRGINGIRPKRQIEIQPYVLTELATFEKEPGNPFADGTDTRLSAGVDGKVGITNDLSLDFTINPDFGQVEADPSVLTLDGYQIFFSERRPFFIQNRDLFHYNISRSEAGGNYDNDNLFYSRRIGARPHLFISSNPSIGRYVDQPDFSSILGAAKFSGKTQTGLSLGILEAVTARERAKIETGGNTAFEVVEPLTNYFVGTVRQDLSEGRTVIGGILTAVHRDLHEPQLNFLHKSAQTGGIHLHHRWKDRTWDFQARLVLSRVTGSQEAIQRTQASFEHGFTRPDVDHLHFDPNATELIGHGGNLALGKYGGDFKFQTGVTWRSPKLELNDIGFMLNSDEINHYTWIGYHEQDPFSVFRAVRLNYNHWLRWDFGGRNLYRAVNTNFQADFRSFWRAGTGITYEHLDISSTWLRGGPAYRRSSGMGHWFSLYSDVRKKVAVLLDCNYGFGFDYLVRGQQVNLTLRLQLKDALDISLGPAWTNFQRIDQYVTTRQWEGHPRYITGHVHQRTMSLTARINYNITPDFTVQYYGQPFISRGTYRRFNYVLDPMTSDKSIGLHVFEDKQIHFEENIYLIDENGDGSTDYTFDNPDFNFIQFRSNLVARWEYTPGSELYLVWTQGNTVFGLPDERGLFRSLSNELFGESTRNTFLLKLTYRFLNK